MNIFEKMAAITAEVEKIKKDLEVGYGKNKYKGTSEGAILAAIKPLEEKYKVYSYSPKREILSNEFVDFKSGDADNPTVRTNHAMIIKTYFEFINIENPEEKVSTEVFGVGLDPADKAAGKAVTYSDKYALMKAYKIETGDDPDQTHSDEYGNYSRSTERKSTKKPISKAVEKTPITAQQQNILCDFIKEGNERVKKALAYYKVQSVTELTADQAQVIIEKLKDDPHPAATHSQTEEK